MWCQNVSAITHATQRHSKYHFILVMIPKGGQAFFWVTRCDKTISENGSFLLALQPLLIPFTSKKFAKKVWESFDFLPEIWFQGQQFCEDHCRHDVQCLLAMPASTGCYRAMRPTNSSCGGSASRMRRWLQREISGKLCQIGQGFNCTNHVDTMNYALRFEDVQLVPWRFFSADC